MTSPFRLGREPTQMGTVSTWAESMRRGPRMVPGSFKNRLPTWPLMRRAFVGVIGRESAGFDAGFGELRANEVHDGGFFAAAAGDGHHFHDHFRASASDIGFAAVRAVILDVVPSWQ